MKKKAIIVDLDGTLADITHRRKFVEGQKKDWKNFNRNIIADEINGWCREIIRRMIHDHHVLLVSGRTDELRQETLEWLKKHDVPFTELMMRKHNDHRDDTVVKREIYEGRIRPSFDVLFVIDDRAKVVRMWREAGLICLQCDWGEF
jgi:FMN phosphatase YigB (HAD superfamily)